MTDPPEKLRFALLSRPFSLAAMMAGMVLLGAVGAMTLMGGKPATSEGNHSTTGENAHLAGNPKQEASPLAAPHHDTSDVDDRFTESQLTYVQTSDENDLAATTSTTDQIEHSEMPVPVNAGHMSNDDPFSEENLGFSEPEHAASETAEIKHDLHADGDMHNSHELPATENEHGSSSHDRNEPRNLKKNATAAREEKITQQTVNLMTIADEQLASGSYVQAMRAYQAIRHKSQGTPGAAILMRLALCAEAAGRRAAALEAYRKVAATQADPAWAGVARYGEARCLAAAKRHDGLQSDLLRRVLLDETEFVPTVRNEMLHLIGRDVWKEQSTMVTSDILDDKTLSVPEWSADPARLLEELPLLIHESPTKAEPVQFQVLEFDEETADGISVRLSCGTTRLESLLKKLVGGCRLDCRISAHAANQLEGRTQQIHVHNSTLAMLLDGITIPYDLCWLQKGKSVEILHRDEVTPDELRAGRLRTAERLLRIAVTEGAASRQVGHSRMALATLLYEQKRAADAIQFLQVQIESEPRSVVETEAAFNLGKCLMVLNERNEAREAFLRSIDAAGGMADVKIAAYIFASRLLLEDNQSKLAISIMMRGVAVSEGTTMEPFAALQLGSAFLVFGNPQGANSVLMERREELTQGPGREAAAFVSALARFRAAVLADRREREGWAVVSALAEFKPEQYCGGHWAVLAAEAFEELGLEGQATDAYLLALKKLPESWLRDRTVMRLAERYQKDREFEEARLLLATLTTKEADHMTFQAKLRSAEVLLDQNKPAGAIRACRLLIDATDTPQLERAALRIMGRAYERRKNHQAAIYCFAGMLPEESEEELHENSSSHSDSGAARIERQNH